MIRAIFFDIDGTLLNPKSNRIPSSTLRALHLLKRREIKLFVATGRPKSMVTFLDEYFPFDGFVTLNGQYCFTRKGDILHKTAIPKQDMRQLLEIQKKTPFPCLLIEAEESFMVNYQRQIAEHFALQGLPVPKVYNAARLETNEIYQFLTYNPTQYASLLAPLKGIEITSASPFCFDVIPKGGGKEVGIAATAEHFGLNREEVMVFGDGDNDCRMVSWAGTGVAMENAQEETKQAADYVTAAVWDDGIEKALLHFELISPEELETAAYFRDRMER